MPALRATATELLLLLAPHGGQLTARRNAWSAMSDDAVRARARQEAAAALARAGAAREALARTAP